MENGGNDKYWRGQTSNNNNNNVWWDLGLGEEMGASRLYDYWTSSNVVMNSPFQDSQHQEEVEVEVMMMNPTITSTAVAQYHSSSLYAGGSHVYPDPHLTCLKLGNTNNTSNNKRRQYYFEDGTSNIISTTTAAIGSGGGGGGGSWLEKKERRCYSGDGVPLGTVGVGFGFGPFGTAGGSSSSSSSSTVAIPICQVDGCHVELLSAREYHRRHKVCEVHSKATKVGVLGIEQRFCQQCSRFHVITEFDDSKRSCRRRLAGHNERRRKISSSSSNDHSTKSSTSTTTSSSSSSRKFFDQAASLSNLDFTGGGGGLPLHAKIPSPPTTPRVCNALSLLSTSGVSAADLPCKYSAAALQDLIAENRANIVASQLFLNNQARTLINTRNAATRKRKDDDHDLGGGSSNSSSSQLEGVPILSQMSHNHQQQQQQQQQQQPQVMMLPSSSSHPSAAIFWDNINDHAHEFQDSFPAATELTLAFVLSKEQEDDKQQQVEVEVEDDQAVKYCNEIWKSLEETHLL